MVMKQRRRWLTLALVCFHLSLVLLSIHGLSSPPLDKEKLVARNLFAVCSHLQNPELYSATWADGAVKTNDKKLVASRTLQDYEILSLYPIHAIGFKGNDGNKQKEKEVLFFDDDKDRGYFRENIKHAWNCRYDFEDDDLFLCVNPNRKSLPGWMGHLASSAVTSKETKGFRPSTNCMLVPLPNAFPLCALVSTRRIMKGQELLVEKEPSLSIIQDCSTKLSDKYQNVIRELGSYLQMAYPKSSDKTTLESPFLKINRQYNGLSQLHKDPDILFVENFLTDDECDMLIEMVRPHMTPCLVKNEQTGAIEADETRTSTNANIPQRDVPSIVEKITKLANCAAEQLEILQVLRYEPGQYFLPHTDGFDGPATASGFVDSARLATIFCYLNHVERGGESAFPLLDLAVQPRKGTAVVHFPMTTGYEEDKRTEHEGKPPIVGEKWLLVTWVWMHSRSDERYAEENLPSLTMR